MERNADLHALVGQKVAQQAIKGEMVNVNKAAVEVGYAEKDAYKIARTPSFQRELFFALPYKIIVEMQRRQLFAKLLSFIHFEGCETEEEAQQIAEQGDWEILKIWTTEKNQIYAWVAKPNYEQRDKALDKIYKLSGFYAAEKLEVSTPLEELTDQELREQLVEEGQIIDMPVDKPQTPDSSNFAQ